MSGRGIRTPDQRLRVFVSSTLGELAPERAAVRDAVPQLRLTPIMFELGARPHPPQALYRSYLEQSDVFIGIYRQSYGWVAPDLEISGLEDEYVRSAGTAGSPCGSAVRSAWRFRPWRSPPARPSLLRGPRRPSACSSTAPPPGRRVSH